MEPMGWFGREGVMAQRFGVEVLLQRCRYLLGSIRETPYRGPF